MAKFNHYQVMSFLWSAIAVYYLVMEVRADPNSLAYIHAMIGVYGSLALALLNELLAKNKNNS